MSWLDGLVPGTSAHSIAASSNRQMRVVAGPGTGKSFALKRRVARLLESGIAPRSILPVTFTRVAAEDLHRELVGMGAPGCENLQGMTLHSLALRILTRNYVLEATGRTPRPLNDFEIKPLEADMSAANGGVRKVRKLLKAYEAAWARLQHDEPGFEQSAEDEQFAVHVVAWLIFHRAMLIGELIPQLYHYLLSNPAAAERNEYSHILVDEFQDLNKAEQGVIDLISKTAEICIVGDDDQSIYSFKHAHPEGIRDWIADRPEADDLSLADCRRCPTNVVAMANALIAKNVNRPEPRPLLPFAENGPGDVRIIQYRTSAHEVEGVANVIRDLTDAGVPPGDILVLAQRGVIGTPIYEALVARNVPARSYYAEAELDAEDAQRRFAVLKLFVDREDRVALRWLLGLGSSNWRSPAYRRVSEHCGTTGMTPWTALELLSARQIKLPHTQPLIEQFEVVKAELEKLEALDDLAGVVEALLPDNEVGVRDLRNLALTTLEVTGKEDRIKFLSELSSAISKPEIPSEIHDVRIMSLHKSKGLSAPVTIIAGCVDGLLPKQPDADLPEAIRVAQIEEQRRLFYVGISRVKANLQQGKPGTLILTYAQEMPLASAMGAGISPASSSYGQARLLASRFIREMGSSAPRPIAG
jgi:DNA helicase II / ATP-dependent DNA helicase PcrA